MFGQLSKSQETNFSGSQDIRGSFKLSGNPCWKDNYHVHRRSRAAKRNLNVISELRNFLLNAILKVVIKYQYRASGAMLFNKAIYVIGEIHWKGHISVKYGCCSTWMILRLLFSLFCTWQQHWHWHWVSSIKKTLCSESFTVLKRYAELTHSVWIRIWHDITGEGEGKNNSILKMCKVRNPLFFWLGTSDKHRQMPK